MTDIAIELAMNAVIESIMLLMRVAAVTITISNIEQRQIEEQRVLEERRALAEEVVVWQTMF